MSVKDISRHDRTRNDVVRTELEWRIIVQVYIVTTIEIVWTYGENATGEISEEGLVCEGGFRKKE